MKKNIALISPNQAAYSESFIKAHKELIDGNVFFYHGGFFPTFLDGEYLSLSFCELIFNKLFSRNNSSQRALIKSFKKNKIQCVLTEYGPTGVHVLSVCKKLKIPLICHFHGADISKKEYMDKYKSRYFEMFQYASYIIGVSKKMCDALISIGAPERKVVYTCCGPQEKFYSLQPDIKNSTTFLAIGRFVDKKAPYFLLEAFRIVLSTHANARLIMCGDGYLLNACMNLAKYWGIDHAVEFKGVTNHDDIVDLMKISVAFVQHSITAMDGDSEGTPVGVLEASAAGLPVISTFHAGIPDVVVDGKTGFLVQEQDIEGMANKMIFVLENKETTSLLGKNGRENVERNYSIKNHIEYLNRAIFRSCCIE
jgi:Glycosyltransferase